MTEFVDHPPAEVLFEEKQETSNKERKKLISEELIL